MPRDYRLYVEKRGQIFILYFLGIMISQVKDKDKDSTPYYRHNRQEFLPLEEQERYADKVTRFIIARDCFQLLRQELRLLGVNHVAIFPDLSGLSADIQAEFLDSWRGLDTV